MCKDLLNIYAFDIQTDLIDHSYFLVMNVWELAQDQQGAFLSWDKNKLMSPESQQETLLFMNNNKLIRSESQQEMMLFMNNNEITRPRRRL